MGMEEITKKINNFMTVSMGITISTILATFGTIMSGHFSIITLILSLVVSIALALLIGFTIPIRKLVEKCTERFTGVMEAIIDNFIMNFIYVIIISTTNVFLMTSLGNVSITHAIDNIKQEITILEENNKEDITLEDKEANEKEIKTLNKQIENMEISRPVFKEALPRSLVSSFIISFILSFIFRKIFLGYALKKNGVTL